MIIILASPRSGSSMTAGIFHHHGVWVGNCKNADARNKKGYFENLDLKKLLLNHFGRMESPKNYNPDFTEAVKPLLPKEPFLFKHSALYHRAWDDFNPKFIKVRRDFKSSLMSNIATNFLGKDPLKAKRLLEKHYEAMDSVPGVEVYTDEIIKGDYSSLNAAFDYCGMELDHALVDEFVEPSLWHYQNSQPITT